MAYLKTMSIAKLQDLRNKLDAAISERVSARRLELETELAKLEGRSPRDRRGKPAARVGRRGSVPPKYRNPENPAETWAGRGLKPRWLAAAMKLGKKLEDFAIAGAGKTSAYRTKLVRKK
jgi:DNA-binding protein H-NS